MIQESYISDSSYNKNFNKKFSNSQQQKSNKKTQKKNNKTSTQPKTTIKTAVTNITKNSFEIPREKIKYSNKPIYCSNCGITIMKSALNFSCEHILCIFCITRQILKNGLKDFKNFDNKFIIECFCKQGNVDVTSERLISLLYIPQNCLAHGEKMSCENCEMWTSKLKEIKKCKYHPNNIIKFYCKNCDLNACEHCLSSHNEHKILNIKNLENDIEDLKQNKLKFKNFNMFFEKLKEFHKNFIDEINYHLNKNCNKIDEIIFKLNKIKNEYIENLNKKTEYTNKIFEIIKYLYYNYYKDLNNVQNDYSILQYLHENKYELQSINFTPLSNFSNHLILIDEQINNNLSIKNTFDFEINIRNNYTFVSQEFIEHTGYVYNIIQLNKNYLASCGEDKKIIIWDLNSGQKFKEIYPAHNSIIYSLCKEKKTKKFYSGSYCEIKIWSKVTFENLYILKGHSDYITLLKFIEGPNQIDSKLTKSYLVSGANDKLIKIWDLEKNICLFTLEGHSDVISSIIQFNKNYENFDCNQIISCSQDRTIKFWDISSEKCIYSIDQAHNNSIYSMILLKNGEVFVTGGYTEIKFWNIKNKECKTMFTDNNVGVFSMVELNDGRLATANFKYINIWSIEEKKLVYTLEAHKSYITCMIILKNMKLGTCADDGIIKIWE